MSALEQRAHAFGFLFGAWRLRPRIRKTLNLVSILLAVSGLVMLGYPSFTDLYSRRRQGDLSTDFGTAAFRRDYALGRIAPGRVLTRIRIPSISVDALIVEGTDAASLRAGAGHYTFTPLPCEPGNVGIAGHRNTYGEPFNRLDEMRAGDEIQLVTPSAACTYRVIEGPAGARRPFPGSAGWITHPNDSSVLEPERGRLLTLTTCHPDGSSRERLIVRARLVRAKGV